MRIFLQFTIIVAICIAGEILHRIVGVPLPGNIIGFVPLPGNIIGFVLLLVLLCTKVLKLEQISAVSGFFLNHLAFFFLPPSIAIMTVGEDILSQWPLLLFLCIVFTIITIAVGGRCTQFLIGRQECRENKQEGGDK